LASSGGKSVVDQLLIRDGVFTCTEQEEAAGIGAGKGDIDGSMSLMSNLTILGGEFNLAGAYSAGLGSGYGYGATAGSIV
jgi:hypothetical protein